MKQLWLFSIVLFTLHAIELAAQETAKTTIQTTEISIQRTTCLGLCPADELVLYADGRASYIGQSGAKNSGVYIGFVQVYDFKLIAELMQKENFFGMPNSFAFPYGPAETKGTFINAIRGNYVKTVNVLGEQPLELWAIQMAIRGVASDIEWQKHEGGIRGTVTNAPPEALVQTRDGKTFPRAFVSVKRYEKGHDLQRAAIDDKGKFEIALPPGTYFATVEMLDAKWKGADNRTTKISVPETGFVEAAAVFNAK